MRKLTRFLLGSRFHNKLMIIPLIMGMLLCGRYSLYIANMFVGSNVGLVIMSLVIALVLWVLNVVILYLLVSFTSSKQTTIVGLANSWGISCGPWILGVIPYLLIMIGVSSDIIGVIWQIILFIVASSILLIRKKFVCDVLGLSVRKIALVIVAYLIIVSVPWSLYQSFVVQNYQTNNLAFFESININIPYYLPGQNTVTVNRYTIGKPEIGDKILYTYENNDRGAPKYLLLWPFRLYMHHPAAIGEIIEAENKGKYLLVSPLNNPEKQSKIVESQIIGEYKWFSPYF